MQLIQWKNINTTRSESNDCLNPHGHHFFCWYVVFFVVVVLVSPHPLDSSSYYFSPCGGSISSLVANQTRGHWRSRNGGCLLPRISLLLLLWSIFSAFHTHAGNTAHCSEFTETKLKAFHISKQNESFTFVFPEIHEWEDIIWLPHNKKATRSPFIHLNVC